MTTPLPLLPADSSSETINAESDLTLDVGGALIVKTGGAERGRIASAGGATGVLASRADIMAAAQGFTAEVYSRTLITSGSAPTSGNMTGMGVGLRAGEVITNVLFAVSTAAIGTVPTLIKGALLDATGKVLNQSANVAASSVWTTTNSPAVVPLGAPVTIPADGLYYVTFLKVGTFATQDLQLGRVLLVSGLVEAKLAGFSFPMATQTGQTDFVANNSSQTLGSPSTSAWWAAVN